MNFILSNENFAVNIAFVKQLAVERVMDAEVHVKAELDDDSDVALKIFDLADADKNYRAAKKFLAELVGKLNEDYTDFILNLSESRAVNIAFVKQFSVERVIDAEVHVKAELDDDSDVALTIFDSADADENYRAAQEFLAELVDKLNEDCTDFILSRNESCAVNVAFVKQLAVERVIDAEVHVKAELDDDSDVVLKTFDSADANKNYRAAKKFLAELVAELNGGA